ncbi:MAG: MarR family transcriptional regulator [Candidatus Omnitrophota bacterium]
MVPNKRVDIGNEISRLQPLIFREVTKKQKTIFAKKGITFPHIIILDFLKENGTRKMGDLAEVLHLTMSAVTGIVDKMIEDGFVKREHSKKDRRIVMVTLIKKGKVIARQISEERRNIANDVFSVLTQKEKKEYLRLISKVHNELRKKNEKD